MRKIINRINKYFWFYRSMLKTRDSNLLLFGAWFGNKYDDNPKFLYEYIINNRKDLDVYWITKNNDIYNKLKEEKKPVLLAQSNEAKHMCLKAKYVFFSITDADIGEDNVKYLGGAYKINLWHGIPIKKIGYDDNFSNWNKFSYKIKLAINRMIEFFPFRNTFLLSTSSNVTNNYVTAFKMKRKNIVELGQPRNDLFYTKHVNPYKERFKGKKIILYMPTHRNEGKTEIDCEKVFDLKEINNWCDNNNYIFVIKKHFYHSKEKIIDNNKYNSIVEITNEVTETQELLDAAEILITDYSGCYIDYLLKDKPIVFYNYDMDSYKNSDREMYYDYDEITPGYKCQDCTNLIKHLEILSKEIDDYKEDRKRVRSFFYSENTQGVVSDKIINYFLKK